MSGRDLGCLGSPGHGLVRQDRVGCELELGKRAGCVRRRLGCGDRAFRIRMQSRAAPFDASRVGTEGARGRGSSGELVAAGS